MKISIFTLFLLFFSLQTFAQKQDAILGKWLSDDKKAHVEIYKKGDKYFGKITWLRNDVGRDGERPKRDVNNPDPKKRNNPIVGSDIVKNLEWDADDDEWDDGDIYDPRSGKTYSAFARLEDANTLYIKGYIGFSLIGKSTTWTRLES